MLKNSCIKNPHESNIFLALNEVDKPYTTLPDVLKEKTQKEKETGSTLKSTSN